MASYNQIPGLSYQREQLSAPYAGQVNMYANQTLSGGPYSEILSSLPLNNCVDVPPGSGRNEMVFIPPPSDAMSLPSINGQSNTGTDNSVAGDSQNFSCQGLSLSLGTQMNSSVSMPSLQYQYQNLSVSSCLSTHVGEGDESDKLKALRNMSGSGTDELSYRDVNPNMYQYEQIGYANSILKSKYLKAAQQLLDEVVNVRKALKQNNSNKDQSVQGISVDEPKSNESVNKSELSPTERQDLQNKKTKLLSMVDEVDRRYKQYYYQMQAIVTSFDMVAGHGAAKMYTALALQTISRHFRCLRDAISGQIQVIQRSLGEPETLANGQGAVIPRLRFIDHQLRQQRALQQLGVMRNAWRPQRGLPESSVSILRAWLFEHFLHPYPSDSEKLMLAKQTGLTRNQVANWFINARVRLWKPMVEEMYKEEFGGDPEMSSKSSPDNAAKASNENFSAPEDKIEEFKDTWESASELVHGLKSENNTPDVEKNRSISRSEFQNRADGDFYLNYGMMKLQDDPREHSRTQNIYSDGIIPQNPQNQNSIDPLMGATAPYGTSELSSFTIGNQVSLALGLQHCESETFSAPAGTNNVGNNNTVALAGHEAVDYHCMEAGNQQDRFGNPHLLHDFVV